MKANNMKHIGKEIVNPSANPTEISKSPTKSRSPIVKTPFLVKEAINHAPGFGLWCMRLDDRKDEQLLRKEIAEMINSQVYNSKNISDDLMEKMDKIVIDRLKLQIKQLIVQLEQTLGKYHESQYQSQNAEKLLKEYSEIVSKANNDKKEIFEQFKNLESKFINLTAAYNNSKKEILRLNNEILNEREKSAQIEAQCQKVLKEKEKKEEDLHKELQLAIAQIELHQEQLDQLSNNPRPMKRGSMSMNNEKNMKQLLKENNSMNSSNLQQEKVINDVILNLRLEIVEMKKKVSEDDIHKAKLNEIIRIKKEKNKVYKNHLGKLITLFEECEKEVEWKNDIVKQKLGIIQILKVKINEKEKESKKLYEEVEKLKNLRQPVPVEESKDEELLPVVASPQFFK